MNLTLVFCFSHSCLGCSINKIDQTITMSTFSLVVYSRLQQFIQVISYIQAILTSKQDGTIYFCRVRPKCYLAHLSNYLVRKQLRKKTDQFKLNVSKNSCFFLFEPLTHYNKLNKILYMIDLSFAE